MEDGAAAMSVVAEKWARLSGELDERQKRLWAATEALSLGRGGVLLVSKATGIARSTIGQGKHDLKAAGAPADLVKQRRRGGGAIPRKRRFPHLVAELEALVLDGCRGDPETPLRWTAKSTATLAAALTAKGMPVSSTTVRNLLVEEGYSLQGNSRMKEGSQHPNRDAQFNHIATQSKGFLARGVPVVSVDTKKKELVGEFANRGREWRPKGQPVEVLTYDFAPVDATRAIPYGVYDVGAKQGFVNVGTDHDTPLFAVHSLNRWWELLGKPSYPDATELYITADSGGSNSKVSSVWKAQLQQFADDTGVTVHVSHFPPGTSKWNPIEHRLFSFISLNWRGRPLINYETVISLISATKTKHGLRVRAELDRAKYPLGITVQRQVLERVLKLTRHPFQGDWNYSIAPRSPAAIEPIRLSSPRKTAPPQTRTPKNPHWRELFIAQAKSGMSRPAFCDAHKLNYDAFKKAFQRMRADDQAIQGAHSAKE